MDQTMELELKTLEEIIPEICNREAKSGLYRVYSIIPASDPDREKAKLQLFNLQFEKKQSKLIASFLGMAIGDALGANTEFLSYDRTRKFIINGFEDLPLLMKQHNLSRREIGIWTDDASMGLCLADTILATSFKFDAIDLRYRFQLWLHYGYNNGGRPYSIGLGGNISISMTEFIRNQTEETETGDRMNNGNGSIMRLAAVPVGYHDDEKLAMEVAAKQSRTTHNGLEAEECCKLMTLLMIRLYNYDGIDPKEILRTIGDVFETTCETVQCLAKSQCESEELFKKSLAANESYRIFNKKIKDRDWNWQAPTWDYSSTRVEKNDSYIGSYCMDGLAMALHICYHTHSFKEAVIWADNMGGDADTVASIAGQIAGAMYGLDESVLHLYKGMEDVTKGRYEVLMRAYKLANKMPVTAAQ
jgi:ADP-ribosylglycohydrolase